MSSEANSVQNSKPTTENSTANAAASYLVFRLGQELFGTELLKVLEVMKLPVVKEVPYMRKSFKGVLNLRGQIVGVVDMRVHFEVKIDNPTDGMVLIVETGDGSSIGAIVDELISVEQISEAEVDHRPIIETKVPSQFLTGIAKKNERLMTLIDISGCLSSTELRSVRQKGKAA